MSEEKKETIDRFIGMFAFLSNFYTSTIYVDGKSYASVEHAYQAFKTLDPVQHETIRNAKTPGEAKKLGRAIPLRKDWETVKVDLMKDFVHRKFENPFLREMLLATDEADLVEGNHWNDTFWGVCRGVGQNWLGRILMDERASIQEALAKEIEEFVNVT
jgi:ribA/ribD-fused uncharacterized protein